MENEKIFEFVENMYVDLKSSQEAIYSDLKFELSEIRNEVKKTNILLNTLNEQLDMIQVDVNALTMKTAYNNTCIIRLDKTVKAK